MEKIIDSHHHLWNYNQEDYDWIDAGMELLKKSFLPNDLYSQMIKVGVFGTIAVQARQSIEETEWLLSQAAEYSFIKGVVGWLDLRSDKLEKDLLKYSKDPKFVGLRHVIHDEPDDDFMLQDEFLKGIEMLQKYGLTYDFLLFPRHLKNAIKLVKMFPEQVFVLDHISKPLIKKAIMEPWKADIASLALNRNVWCKISGMITEADTENWSYEDFVPYLDVVVSSFGMDRIMLGSDWPVCKLAGEYEDVFQIPKRYFKAYDADSKEKIFYKNCLEFYKLQTD